MSLLDSDLFWVHGNDCLLGTSVHAYIQTRCHLPLSSDWPNAYYGGCTSYIHLKYLQYSLHPPSSNKEYPYILITS